jgi:hypothetical protein
VNNNGLHGMKTVTGKKTLRKGVHPLKVEFFEAGGNAGCILKYAAKETGWRAVVVGRRQLLKKPGIVHYNHREITERIFYFPQGSRLQNLARRRPDAIRKVRTINYKNTNGRWPGYSGHDHFSVRWTALLVIKLPGKYGFLLSSDDGSKLWIDQKTIVDNDGIHGWRTRTGYMSLKAGIHELQCDFFEKTGSAGIVLKLKGKDTGGKWLPFSEYNMKFLPPTLKIPDSWVPFMLRNSGLTEEVFYFKQSSRLSSLKKRKPNSLRTIGSINYIKTAGRWKGFARSTHFAVRWYGSIIMGVAACIRSA